MDAIKQLRQLVDEYIVFSLDLRKRTSTLRSLFGPRTEEIEDPGHQQFDSQVERWVRDFAASQPSQEALTAAVELLLFCAKEQENKAPYWYLTVIQRHSMILLPLLSDSRRAQLLARFTAEYPPRRQLPLQTQIHRMLDPGAKPARFSLLRQK